MQKLLNEPADFVDEVVSGMVLAHPDRLALLETQRALVRKEEPKTSRVAIVTGGGSGHLPLFAGYVTRGLVDGCAVGDLFASPSSEQILEATREVNRGRGVLYLYGNYQGDRMNFDLCAELAAEEDIETASVRGADDVSSAPPDRIETRRGVAGIYFGYVVAAARAAFGDDLKAVAGAAERVLSRTRSMGVALAPCTLPTVGKPNFEVQPGQMEIGMGIHGEPGVHTGPLRNADEVTDVLVDSILDDRPIPHGGRIAVLVNGLGATPLEELYVLARRVHIKAEEAGLMVHKTEIGEFATSLEMAGASISIVEVDEDLERCLAWSDDRRIGDTK